MADQPDPNPSAYAGRWVALVRGKIIAHGQSREQVFHAARSIRNKEDAEIRYMPAMPVTSPLLEDVRALLPLDEPVYLVGGAVRDAVMGHTSHDLDFACRRGLETAKKVANGLKAAYFPLDQTFDTGRIVIQNPDGSRDFLDFTGFRGDSLEADLAGRDFTINAVAMDLHTGQILDPLGGVNDIRARLIRACAPDSLTQDPIRILRAVRQAAAFGFSIHPETRALMKTAAPLLKSISAERLRDELFKMLSGRKPDASIRALEMLGVLPFVLPELPSLRGVEQSAPHVQDVWAHTLGVLRQLETILDSLAPNYDEDKANSDLFNGLLVLRLGRYREQVGAHLGFNLNADRSARGLLFFAALYHDIDKPQTKTIEETGRIRFLRHDELGARTALARGSKLHFSNTELERLGLIIKHHMRVHGQVSRKESGHEPSRKAIYRFFRDAGESGIDLVLLALADTRATYEHTLTQEHWIATLDVCRTLLESCFEKPEEVIRPRPLVNGDDLQTELKLNPGPEIGKILEAIRENQAAAKISSREEALAFARGWAEKTRSAARESPSSKN